MYPGTWFNIKMSSYQYRKSHCGDKTILRPSYLHNGISYTGKTTSLYWIGVQISVADISGKLYLSEANQAILVTIYEGMLHQGLISAAEEGHEDDMLWGSLLHFWQSVPGASSFDVQMLLMCLFCAKSSSKPLLGYCQLDPYEQSSVKFWLKY